MIITEIDQGAGCSIISVKEESVASSSGVESGESGKTTPVEEEVKLEDHRSTRGVKVRYASDEDDEYTPKGNPSKKRKTGGRGKGRAAVVKPEARDNGGVYKPSKKRIRKKVDPNRCQDCRQRIDDPNLKVPLSELKLCIAIGVSLDFFFTVLPVFWLR